MNERKKSRSGIIFCAVFTALLFTTGYSQTGISLNTPAATESYTLYLDYDASTTFLIDNCGQMVHSWPGVGWAQFHPKLLPNGHLMYSTFSNIWELDWEGNVMNQVTVNQAGYTLEYEQIKLANGNYLTIARKEFTDEEFIELGYDLEESSPYQVDVILEVDGNSGEVVWEWNIADHVIQERDAAAGNYGVVAEHPELLNMDAISHIDWSSSESFMINGFDYHPELDQIVLSLRKMSEFVIIDHSTTTEEAAGHNGGKYGKGGDILYRWGNPENYGRGTEEDRFLYYQHNPNWITEGPHKGKIVCFNNGLYRPDVTYSNQYSEIPIIPTSVVDNGNYALALGQAYLPLLPEINYSGANPEVRIYSSLTSGAKVFPSGNVFVIEGGNQRLLELNTDGELIWEYTIPEEQLVYRAEKYELDYPAFVGKDLTPQGPVANTNSTYNCELITGVNKPEFNSQSFTIRYLNERRIEMEHRNGASFSFQFIDMQGRILQKGESSTTKHQLDLGTHAGGMYVLVMRDEKNGESEAEKILLR